MIQTTNEHPLDCEAQLAWKCLFTPTFFRRTILTSKWGQTDLVFGVRSGSLVGLCMKDYKSLCAAVTICATYFNIHTHRQGILTGLYDKACHLLFVFMFVFYYVPQKTLSRIFSLQAIIFLYLIC